MEDWRVRGGRIECVRGGADRNVHLLTHQLGAQKGEFMMSVLIGRADEGKATGAAGFRVGIQSDLGDYRSALLFGKGSNAGLTSDGRLFIGIGPKSSSRKIALPFPTARLTLLGWPITSRSVTQPLVTEVRFRTRQAAIALSCPLEGRRLQAPPTKPRLWAAMRPAWRGKSESCMFPDNIQWRPKRLENNRRQTNPWHGGKEDYAPGS